MAPHMAYKRCCCMLQAEKSSFPIHARLLVHLSIFIIHLHLASALAQGSLARDFVHGTVTFLWPGCEFIESVA